MKYKYIKKVFNHDSLPLKLEEVYTIKKDNKSTNCYIITNYGLIITEYALNNCFKKESE